MRLAHKFGLPIITFIDTAGAYPGIGAEERHIAEAIAVNLREMMLFDVPIIATVVGEGGSGGALGIGVANRVLILANRLLLRHQPRRMRRDSVEGSIGHHESRRRAEDYRQRFARAWPGGQIVPEPLGGAHNDAKATIANLKASLLKHLTEILALSPADRLKQRYAKFRGYGRFLEPKPARKESTAAKSQAT